MATFSVVSGQPTGPIVQSPEAVTAWLAERGVRYAWHPVVPELALDDSPSVVRAYERLVREVQADGGYRAVDVVRLSPDNPQRDQIRAKFLVEHTHEEDEVRYFAAGRGVFFLRLDEEICRLLCGPGDLLHLPAGVPHAFDVGAAPELVAIRWFTDPEGWIARPTGEALPADLPLLGWGADAC